MVNKLFELLKNYAGATMAEYAVIAAVVIMIAILAFTGLGAAIVARISVLANGF